MLKRGDNPGPWPGAGRPKNEFRERCRKISEENLPEIEEIIKGTAKRGDMVPSFGDSRQAWKDVGMMGFGEAKPVMPEELAEALAQAIAEDEQIPSERVEPLLTRIFELLK